MKLRFFITTFFVIFQMGLVYGQDFAPSGAEWYYTEQYAFSGDISYLHIKSVGDTTIKGEDCRILNSNGGLVCAFGNNVNYVYYKDSIAYFYVPQIDSFQVLYNLRAQKDSSWTVVFGIGLEEKLDTLQIIVDSVSTITINSQNLKKLHVTYKSLNAGWENLEYGGEIIERIGDTYYLFNLYTLSGMVCDGNYSAGLRCYTDPELGSYSTGISPSCTYTYDWVGIKNNSDLDFKVYPNPTSNWVEITTNFESDFQIKLYSITGNLISAYEKNGNSKLDLTNMDKGVYLIQVCHKNNFIGMRKIIKN